MNPNQIIQYLEKLPAEISKSSEEAEKARVVWQIAKEELKRLEAKTSILHKIENPKSTSPDIANAVTDDDVVHDRRIAVIMKESDYKLLDIKTKEHDDLFQGMRKQMNWHIAELQNTRRV